MVIGFAVTLTACGGTGSGGRLLLAGDITPGETDSASGASRATATDIWSVSPGEEPSDSDRVATGVLGPLPINTVNVDGTISRDALGTIWNGHTLLSFQDAAAKSVAAVGRPGKTATTLAESQRQLQTNVLRRGVYLTTEDRCDLARTPTDVRKIGTGLCQISEDERWVVSWPAQGGKLAIRDLRTGTVRTVDGTTAEAVVLGHGTSVLAVQAVDGGKRGVVIDATTGKVTGRTDVYREIRPVPVTAESTGFTALVATADGSGGGSGDGASASESPVQETQLLWIDTSASVRVIDRGLFMLPVHTDSTVTYVRMAGATAGSDSIRRWDSSNGSRRILLTGRVGAAAAGADGIVATRDTERGVELYRGGADGLLERVATLEVDASQGSSVGRVVTLGDTAYLELAAGGTMALARIDLTGDASDVPVRGWAQLNLEGIDTDGTALLTGYRTADDQQESIGVVTPASDRFVERTRAGVTGVNLIREGVIYVTERTGSGELRVRSVRAQGDLDRTMLYRGYQIAGSTWPIDNGGTISTMVSRVAVQQAQRSQAGAAGGGSTGGNTGGGGTADGSTGGGGSTAGNTGGGGTVDGSTGGGGS